MLLHVLGVRAVLVDPANDINQVHRTHRGVNIHDTVPGKHILAVVGRDDLRVDPVIPAIDVNPDQLEVRHKGHPVVDIDLRVVRLEFDGRIVDTVEERNDVINVKLFLRSHITLHVTHSFTV